MKLIILAAVAAFTLSGCARVHYANCASFGTDCDTLTAQQLEQVKEGKSYSGRSLATSSQASAPATAQGDNATTHIIQCSLSGGRWDGSTCYHAPAPQFVPLTPSTTVNVY